MSIRFNEQELQAVVRLTSNDDFKQFISKLCAVAEQRNEALVRTKFHDVNELFEMRGAVSLLVDITEAVHEAPTRLEQYNNQEP